MLLRVSKITIGIYGEKKRGIKKLGGENEKLKTKTIGTLLIAGLVVLSAMVVFATPVVAVDIWDGEDECDDDDPIRFNGTITMADGPWANKHVCIAKWRWGLHHGWGWYTPWLGHWKVQTDGDGYYQTLYAPWLPGGHFGLFVRETTSDPWELLEERDLVLDDYDEDYRLHWTYQGWDYDIPEFASIAIPAIAVLGLFLFFNKRKQRKD